MSQPLAGLRCPLCQEALSPVPVCPARPFWQRATWACSQGHSFDVARQGYLHLLPVQHKRSRLPGDTPESVAARRAFLSAGHYDSLRSALAAAVATLPVSQLLDIGCGEGHYTSGLMAPGRDVAGLDIAKAAVVAAAARTKSVTWLVGSAFALPLADTCVDVVTSVFSPLPAEEIRRVLRPGGHLLVAQPAADHLHEFRAALYGEVVENAPAERLGEQLLGFAPVSRQRVVQPLSLSAVAVGQLMTMTPYAWKAPAERRAALSAGDGLETTAAFELSVFQRL